VTWDIKQAIGSRRGLVNGSLDDYGASEAGDLICLGRVGKVYDVQDSRWCDQTDNTCR
jgi:hypothetical protein